MITSRTGLSLFRGGLVTTLLSMLLPAAAAQARVFDTDFVFVTTSELEDVATYSLAPLQEGEGYLTTVLAYPPGVNATVIQDDLAELNGQTEFHYLMLVGDTVSLPMPMPAEARDGWRDPQPESVNERTEAREVTWHEAVDKSSAHPRRRTSTTTLHGCAHPTGLLMNRWGRSIDLDDPPAPQQTHCSSRSRRVSDSDHISEQKDQDNFLGTQGSTTRKYTPFWSGNTTQHLTGKVHAGRSIISVTLPYPKVAPPTRGFRPPVRRAKPARQPQHATGRARIQIMST